MGSYNEPVQTMFDNGAELWTLRNELLGASQVAFDIGCRDDPPDASGMAHGFEHVGCRGASPAAVAGIGVRRPSVHAPVTQREADRCYHRFFGGSNGPGINVYTLHSHTGYGHQDLFSPRHLRTVFPIMGGMVRDVCYDIFDMRNRDDAILAPWCWQVERAAVNNETSENDELPSMAPWRAALQALYTTNPARHFGDSVPEHLARLKVGRVKQWAQGRMIPSRMKIVIIGPTRNVAVRMVRDIGIDKIPKRVAAPWHYDRSDDVPVLDTVREIHLQRAGSAMHHVVHALADRDVHFVRLSCDGSAGGHAQGAYRRSVA